MKKVLIRLGKVGSLAYITICLTLFVYQRSFLYFPAPAAASQSSPDVRLNVADASLRISVRPQEAGAPALIYFGGNAEDVSYALPDLARAFPEHALYLMHYRGYGGSTGQPSEKALHADAQRLYDDVIAKHKSVTLVGRSLGSGVAIRLASQPQVERLILITPYDSILKLAQQRFPLVPVSLLLLDRFESWRYAPQIRVPTLIIAAENDNVIPLRSTQALFRAFSPGVATMRTIAGTGHNTVSDNADYLVAITASLPEPSP